MRTILIITFLLQLFVSIPAGAANAPGAHLKAGYQREQAPWLTHEEAILRVNSVSSPEYSLDIDLTGPESYRGKVTIGFDYEPSAFPLTLDFLEGVVESVEIEKKSIPVVYSGHHISIAPGLLSDGHNTITVRYSHAYSQTGAGLYRFVDSTDGRVYLYTHFEPYDANRLVPSFDQPNLRAPWTITVKAPNDWPVVTAVREDRIERGESFSSWYFPPTPAISTYILPLHAGQYHVWEGKAGDVPLRLFARESLAEYVRAEWLLELTAKGIAYFETYFDEPYPFSKYDQLIVPDFNIGGMENVASVTYTERYVPRGEPTNEYLQSVANTFLHELAHMWFGDLVTIDWWNALWLKESFASLMAPLSIPASTEFDAPWLSFYLDSKQAAYRADQFVTTHPIEMPVRDTKSGDASFDAITYSKGASVLKQLNHYLGENVFRDGVREYMNRFGWQAATLPDFMDTLAEVSGRDMAAWSDDWLETAGVNTVKADYSCEDGKVSTFSLIQTAPEGYPTIRNQRLQVGLFGLIDEAIVPGKLESLEISGQLTGVPGLVGEPCPVLVYPNVGDWAFIRVLLDEKSLQQTPELLSRIDDPLLRSMFWQSLWDAVRDQDAPLSAYIDVALKHLPGETNTAILQQLLGRLAAARHYLYLFGSRAAELRSQYLPALETMAWQQVVASKAGSDLRKQWFDAWLGLAESEAGIARIEQWLKGESEPLDLNQDQDRRWEALLQLSGNGYKQIDSLREAESARDPSDAGKMYLIALDASLPVAAAKARHLDNIEDVDGDLSSAQLKSSMYWMFPPGQEALHQQFGPRILGNLPELDRERDQDLMGTLTGSILPVLCTPDSVRQLSASIRDRGTLSLGSTKDLRVSHQEDQRCMDMAQRQFGGLSSGK